MSRRSRSTAVVFARYLLLQLPGLVVVAGVLTLLVHQQHLSSGTAYLLFAAWLAFEMALFPVLRIGYEPGGRHTGVEAMIGAEGVADGDIDPEGHVRIGAERWRAVAGSGAERIAAGAPVRVCAVRELVLVVEAVASPPVNGASER